MRESCCLANDNDWDEAASWTFKLSNWPYVNAEDAKVRECFYNIDKNSPVNLSKDLATKLQAGLSVLLLGFTAVIALLA